MNPQPITEQEMDAYLDGLITADEREKFEQRLRSQPELESEIQRFGEIDLSAKRLFPTEQVPETHVQELIEGHNSSRQTTIPLTSKSESSDSKSTLRIALVALAAVLAWILVAWQWDTASVQTPYFERRPMAEVYHEILESGFEPYYECRDDQRFSDTFLRRQGQALSLAALPPGSQMLGLSYAGGLSRETTAMLCRVDGKPVMVFVDQLENDAPLALQHDSGKTNVYRVARDGLVFYEVTPFGSARVIEYLVAK
ncbi:MAG: anti-sigma factor family protein [Bythopirellula sp.]